MGLSICYGIIEGHGGRIYARSKPGKGAEFVVEIPVSSEPDVTADETGSTHPLVATPRYL
jgi:K+-sensing histidine kinase KdpD